MPTTPKRQRDEGDFRVPHPRPKSPKFTPEDAHLDDDDNDVDEGDIRLARTKRTASPISPSSARPYASPYPHPTTPKNPNLRTTDPTLPNPSPPSPSPQTTPTRPKAPARNPSAEAAGSAIQSRRSSWSNNSGYDLPSPPKLKPSRYGNAFAAGVNPTCRSLDELNQLMKDFDAEYNPPDDDDDDEEDGVEGLIQGFKRPKTDANSEGTGKGKAAQ